MDGRYLGARVGQALLVLWASFTVSFVLLQLLPGDAIAIKFQNPELGLNAAQIAQMRTAYGADAPLWRQYLESLGGAVRGDFGFSLQAGVPVTRPARRQPPRHAAPRRARVYAGAGDRRPARRALHAELRARAASGIRGAAVAVCRGADVLAWDYAIQLFSSSGG